MTSLDAVFYLVGVLSIVAVTWTWIDARRRARRRQAQKPQLNRPAPSHPTSQPEAHP